MQNPLDSFVPPKSSPDLSNSFVKGKESEYRLATYLESLLGKVNVETLYQFSKAFISFTSGQISVAEYHRCVLENSSPDDVPLLNGVVQILIENFILERKSIKQHDDYTTPILVEQTIDTHTSEIDRVVDSSVYSAVENMDQVVLDKGVISSHHSLPHKIDNKHTTSTSPTILSLDKSITIMDNRQIPKIIPSHTPTTTTTTTTTTVSNSNNWRPTWDTHPKGAPSNNVTKGKRKFERKEWTEEEDTLFLSGLKSFGLDFIAIAELIPTRTPIQCRTHYRYLAKSIKQNILYNSGYDTTITSIGERGRPCRSIKKQGKYSSPILLELQEEIYNIEARANFGVVPW